MVKELKCWYSYSSFGDYVSNTTHEEIYDDIVITIPDDIKVFENEYGYFFEVPSGFCFNFNELFLVKNGCVIAQWFDGDKYVFRKCKYRRA